MSAPGPPIAAITLDAAGTVTGWSEGAERLLGRRADEMIGRPWHVAAVPHLRCELVPLQDGAVALLREHATRGGDASLRDAERRLTESEDHFRHTVELNPQVPWTCDPAGNITSYSTRWLELTGQAPGEPDGAGWMRALHPDDVAPTVAAFGTCLASGAPIDVGYRIRVAATGEYRWMRARAQPRRDAHGAILRWYGVVEDVHARHLAETRVRASEGRYRTLFEAIDVGFCIVEMVFDAAGAPADYLFVEANAAFARRIGFTPAYRQSMRAVEPAHDQHWFDVYGRVARTGEPASFEHYAAPSDRWWNVEAFRICDVSPGLVGVLFTDITRRRRDEIALQESRERFRVFAQAVPNHIWAAGPDGTLEWVNDQARLYTGIAADDPLATAWDDWVHAADRPAMRQRWAAALRSGRFFETELRLRRHDGAWRWHVARAIAIREEGGDHEKGGGPGTPADGEPRRVVRWIGASTDIHDQKEAAAALANLNDTLELLVAERTRERDRVWNSTDDLIGTAGLDGFLRHVNPAWRRLLDIPEAELLRQPFMVLIHPADHAASEAALVRLQAGEPVRGFRNRLLPRTGEPRLVMWNAVPDGDVFHISGRDMTELNRIEEQLRQSQKMEAVGQLTGGLAHDFNNLLTGITGSLHLIRRRLAQGRLAEVDRYVEAAEGAATRAAALTHRLLAFSRRQTLDPRAVDVNDLVAGLAELIRRTVGPEITVHVAAGPLLWITLVDPGQLENALLNLCINARDAMPGGGMLLIETANVRLDVRAGADHGLAPGDYVRLAVQDNGTGMTPEVIARAFDPFFTTKPIGQGTGLGLSMVYGFARQSGGEVAIASAPSGGTTVAIHLPRHDRDAGRAAPAATETGGGVAAAHAGRPTVAGKTVLVVDDEPAVRMLVADVLEELRTDTIEAADGAAALRILDSARRIDLLVTDVGLPGGLNGRQVADAARVTRPDLKILFITGYAENAVLAAGQLERDMHVLTKPFAMDTLAARISDLLAPG